MRLPDNKRLQRRFRADSSVGSIAAYLASTGLDMKQHALMQSFPRKVQSAIKVLPVLCKLLALSSGQNQMCPTCSLALIKFSVVTVAALQGRVLATHYCD